MLANEIEKKSIQHEAQVHNIYNKIQKINLTFSDFFIPINLHN